MILLFTAILLVKMAFRMLILLDIGLFLKGQILIGFLINIFLILILLMAIFLWLVFYGRIASIIIIGISSIISMNNLIDSIIFLLRILLLALMRIYFFNLFEALRL